MTTSIRMTLLEIVQSVHSDLDFEAVASIADSALSQQVASVCRDTFYDLVQSSVIPEGEGLLKMEVYSDSEYPVCVKYPANTKKIKTIWYDYRDGIDQRSNYREICYVEPECFIERHDTETTDESRQLMMDPASGTPLWIGNKANPSYFTSFDNRTLIFNSYNSDVDSTLQESKFRAFGVIIPTFKLEDDFDLPLANNVFPLYLNEVKSRVSILFKGISNPKFEQEATRQRHLVTQNGRHYGKRRDGYAYGRRR